MQPQFNLQQKDPRPEPASAKHRRGQTIFAALVAVALLAGFFAVHDLKVSDARDLLIATSKNALAVPRINVVEIQSPPEATSLRLPGDTAAWYESTIYARVDGYVNIWYADIGDHVRKNQILATIDTPDLDAQLAAAQAKFKASIAQIASKEAEMQFGKTTFERWRDSPKGVVSDQEREAKKASYESAIAHLNEAKAQNGLDQANVDRYKALSQFKQVTAPFEGTITQRRIDIGNLVTAGSNANMMPLYRMEQDDPIRIFVNVPQNAAIDMKIGVPAQIRAGNMSNRVFEGKITRTAKAVDLQSRTLRVEVDIPNSDFSLVPGMYVDVTFQIPTRGFIQVPAAALIFRSDGPQVAVVDKNNTVNFHKVTIVRDNGNFVEVGSGVSVGDKIALNAGNQITEGTKVIVNNADGAVNASK